MNKSASTESAICRSRGKIKESRISGGARGDHRGADFLGLLRECVVIDLLGLLVDAVVCHRVKLAGKIRGMPMGEMAAVGEIHRQDTVARFDGGEVDRHVGLRAAVRLHIDVISAKDLLRPIDRELFDDVDILTTAVPTFAGIAFGIFVRQAGTLRFHHCAAGEVLRSDQLNVFALPPFLRDDGVEDFRIDFTEGVA